jgi:hypothetical protein
MKNSKSAAGVIRADEAYSKTELMARLGISQKFWDKMLDEGLPYANVGHAKWVLGRTVMEHLERHSEQKIARRGAEASL